LSWYNLQTMAWRIFKSKIFYGLVGIGAIFSFVFFGVDMIWKQPTIEYLASAVAGFDSGVAEDIKEVFVPTHIKTPEAVKAIYMTSWVASTRDWRSSLVKMVEDTELNSIIIDVKDYEGVISFKVKDEELKKVGSDSNRISDVKEFIASLHKKGIYVIARISVFQDAYLVTKKPDLAVKKKSDSSVWKDRKGITWLDQCSREVWDYTVAVAKEAEHIGFDELNFDYIRFPSDGNMKDIHYDHCPENVVKADTIGEFSKYLSENLKDMGVPISADLFGMVTVNTDDLGIGQVLEKEASYFDYIAPMVYPSHYPVGYNGYKNPADYPYEIIKLGMDTALRRMINQEAGLAFNATNTPSVSEYPHLKNKLRPWLQDFDLGATYDASMIRAQKQAVYDAGLTSWMLWAPSNKYTVEGLD